MIKDKRLLIALEDACTTCTVSVVISVPSERLPPAYADIYVDMRNSRQPSTGVAAFERRCLQASAHAGPGSSCQASFLFYFLLVEGVTLVKRVTLVSSVVLVSGIGFPGNGAELFRCDGDC